MFHSCVILTQQLQVLLLYVHETRSVTCIKSPFFNINTVLNWNLLPTAGVHAYLHELSEEWTQKLEDSKKLHQFLRDVDEVRCTTQGFGSWVLDEAASGSWRVWQRQGQHTGTHQEARGHRTDGYSTKMGEVRAQSQRLLSKEHFDSDTIWERQVTQNALSIGVIRTHVIHRG